MKKLSALLFVMLLFFGYAGMANATLINRGGGLIYDSDQDITWLQDANYAMTSAYDGDGLMNWANAMAWAENLNYYDSVRNVTWTGWRLPSTPGTVEGWTDEGEMGQLRYNDGIYSNNPFPFTDVQTAIYWTNKSTTVSNACGYYFSSAGGMQYRWANKAQMYLAAWAIRPGDVSTPIPEPATMLLLGSSLAGLGIFRRKIRRRHG